jgi:hypothetical protein
MEMSRLALVVIALAVLAAISFSLLSPEPSGPKPYHTHADFKVYLDGAAVNFSQSKYMSTENQSMDKKVHLHDMDGDIIHHHARNVTMAYFFGTLNMTYNSTCFVSDVPAAYCDGGNESLRMFVRHSGGNWTEIADGPDYVFQDLDQLLITYGPIGGDVSAQEASVTDKACIESQKCPERGNATDSTCAGDVCQAPT